MTSIKTTGIVGFFKFIINHWWIIIFILSIIPSFIFSIQTSIETNNPTYWIIHPTLSIINADSELYHYVSILETDTTSIIGLEKPTAGILNNIAYSWGIAKVVWLILGLIFLITVPFTLLFRFMQKKDTTSPLKNLIWTIIYVSIFLFIINLILIVVGLLDGSILLNFNEQWNIYQKSWYVIKQTFPFHGLIELVKYLFSFF